MGQARNGLRSTMASCGYFLKFEKIITAKISALPVRNAQEFCRRLRCIRIESPCNVSDKLVMRYASVKVDNYPGTCIKHVLSRKYEKDRHEVPVG